MEIIYSCLFQNKLILNVQKSVFITFSNYSDCVPASINLKIIGQAITRVTSAKYIGLTYDCNMKWDVHIHKIVKKNKVLSLLFYRLRQLISKKQLLQLYYGLFHSVAVYGLIRWGGFYQTPLYPLKRLQNCIFKLIGVTEHDIDKPLTLRQVFMVNSIIYISVSWKINMINTRWIPDLKIYHYLWSR